MSPAENSLEAANNCIVLIHRAEIKGFEGPVVAACLAWLGACKEKFEAEVLAEGGKLKLAKDEVTSDQATA